MISPNRQNIDRWLFDYTEGNLSSDQESLLEKFLLNNPDIEVDLDAWQEAKLVPEEIVLTDKNKFKRKRRLAPLYFTSLLILLISGSVWVYLNPNSNTDQKVVSVNQVQETAFQANKQNSSRLNYSADQVMEKSNSNVLQETKNSAGTIIRNQNHFSNGSLNSYLKVEKTSEGVKNKFITGLISDKPKSYSEFKPNDFIENSTSPVQQVTNAAISDLSTLRLKTIDSKSLKLDLYQIQNDELNTEKLIEGEAEIQTEGISLDLGNIKLFQKIGKVLEKDLGLSNIPDHTYAIPEYSNVDVLFSNIGATSQFRFQSTSMARWIENLEQRKFSQQITLDGYSRGAQSGFGLQANYDYFANGSIQNWNTCLLFSPKIAISRSVSIEPALRLKIGNKILNDDRIENHTLVNYESQTANQFNFDSSIAIGSKLWYRDLDFGFTINTPYFYVGGQVSNLLRHQNNIYSNYENMDMRAKNTYNAIIGTQYISRNQKIQFSPYFFLEKAITNRVFAGFSLKLNKIMLGGSYGTGNVTTGTLGLSLTNLAIYAQSTYGFAPAISKNSFTHQLTIRFNSNVDKKSRRYITL